MTFKKSKFGELKQGTNQLIWNKIERKFVWRKLSSKTVVVEKTIAYIELDGRNFKLMDKNAYDIAYGTFDDNFYTLKHAKFSDLIADYAIDEIIYNLIFVDRMDDVSILLNHLLWKADKIA